MALTSNEERALGVSEDFIKAVREELFKLAAQPFHHVAKTPPLYRQRYPGADNSTIQYQIRCEGDINNVIIERVGYEPPGRRVVHQTVVKPSKTLSALERLEADLFRRIRKNTREAWCESPTAATITSATSLKKPMLLHRWDKYGVSMTWPCIAQVKIDGIRCMWDAGDQKLYSRSGKVIDMPHVVASLTNFPDTDGELAFEDHTVPLPEVIHAIAHKDTRIRFHIFDFPTDDTSLSFRERFLEKLPHLIQSSAGRPAIKIVNTMAVKTRDELDDLYTEAVSNGFEGLVVRKIYGTYQYGKRSQEVLKYKFEIEKNFMIQRVKTILHQDGPMIMFECKTDTGAIFEVVPAWTHEARRIALKEHENGDIMWVGRMLLVEYRGLTPDGKPYHAVGKTPYVNLRGKQ